jgi:hypothetical protein
MGLIYSLGESGALSSAMASNIATGQAIVASLNTACNQLLSALSGGTLSGAAYTAGKGLFTDLVIPSVSKVSAALGNLSSELSTYNAAAGEAGGEYLNEDKLKEQLRILKKRKKDLEDRIEEYDRKMMTTPDASLCMMYARFQQQLMEYLRIVKEDIEKIKKKLEKLYAFDGAVGGLFANSLSALQLAAQSVTILSAMTVDSSTGKFKFPKGTDKSWFTELHNSKADKATLKKLLGEEDKVEIKWISTRVPGRSTPRVYVNGKVDWDKTATLTFAMAKVEWEQFKTLGTEFMKELIGVNDVKTLMDSDSTLAENGISLFSLLVSYFPATKAVKVYKGMEAAKLIKTGITTTADLQKVSKIAGLTAKEAQALSDMWKLEEVTAAGKLTESVQNISQNTVTHILQSHHDWGKVVKDPKNWEQVRNVVNEVMKKGVESPIGKTDDVFQKVLKVNGEDVLVKYRIMDGVPRISDSYVIYK